MKRVKLKDWEKEGIKLFGKDRKKWKFKCSGCGFIQSVESMTEMFPRLEGLFFASVFCRCIGNQFKLDKSKKIGCDTSLDEGRGKPGIILIIDDKDGHREVPIFDFARPEDIN